MSVISALLFLKSSTPPDERHPYGHYGYNALLALITSLIIIASSSIIATLTVSRISSPHVVRGEVVYYALTSTILLSLTTILLFNASSPLGGLALKAEFGHLTVNSLESLIALIGVAPFS
ncbi:MAG: hypothetical protein B6U69_02190 [Thermofilum sp. ex4484_15]|nr:MAG: hypothetical protein B6U69_02190 [Thermofilum sp. ex4484_15]